MIIDTHCHINEPPLGQNIAQVLHEAEASDVKIILAPGTDERSSQEVVSVASQYPGVISAAVGVHPQITSTKEDDLAFLESLLQQPGVVAIGEIGIDAEVEYPDQNIQIPRFITQLKLAYKHNLPVLIHCRRAFQKMQEILQSLGPGPGGILHSWAGSWDILKTLIPLGFYYGVSGVVTWPKARRRREALVTLPLDRMVLETDAPYIGTLHAHKGQVAPKDIVETCQAVAEIKGCSYQEIAELTTMNAKKLLRLA